MNKPKDQSAILEEKYNQKYWKALDIEDKKTCYNMIRSLREQELSRAEQRGYDKGFEEHLKKDKETLYKYQHNYNRTETRKLYQRHKNHRRINKQFDNCSLCNDKLKKGNQTLDKIEL